MTVTAYDPYPDAAFASELGVTYKPFPQILQGAEIVSVHAPLVKGTRGMIGAKEIELADVLPANPKITLPESTVEAFRKEWGNRLTFLFTEPFAHGQVSQGRIQSDEDMVDAFRLTGDIGAVEVPKGQGRVAENLVIRFAPKK